MTKTTLLYVNGKEHRLPAEPDTPLLYALRNDLGLVGAKLACGLEQCGACLVLLDGQPRPSCKMTIAEATGMEILTIEGLQAHGLHPIQQLLIDEQAAQCGFCTAGFVVAAAALLARDPQPDEAAIRAALDRNLCRCGVYPRILRAVRRAAGESNGGESPIRVIDRPLPEMPAALTPEMPASLERAPSLDRWLRIDPEDTVTIFLGKVEYGQGIQTAIAQLAAEELDLSLDRIRVVTADTDRTPDEGLTTGSMSLETTGQAMRMAAAEARRILLSLALEELEARPENLAVRDGRVRDLASGRSVTYWQLHSGRAFERPVRGDAPLKEPQEYRTLGKSTPRLDLEAKVRGEPAFLHDMQLPGMLHGRVLRPPSYGAGLESLDAAGAEKLPGVVRVVRDGSFVGVVAEREEQAVRALDELRRSAAWGSGDILPPEEGLEARLRQEPRQSFMVVDGTAMEGPIRERPPTSEGARTVRASYFRPFHMHASLGPSAAVALFEHGSLTLWTHAQGVFPIRRTVAQVLSLDEARVRAVYVEGPGCYGHTGADDAALDAALLARACPGRPVALRWSRQDEHGWEPYGPAMAIDLQAELDERGRVQNWDQEIWTYPHLGRPRLEPGSSGLLAAWSLDPPLQRPVPRPAMWNHVGGHRNADPIYAFETRRIVKHFLPGSPLRTSSQRGLGAYANVFAIESFMDELAEAGGEDPLAFRLRNLEDPRARQVLETAAEESGWAERSRPGGTGFGRGLAFARYKNRQTYCAVVIEVEAEPPLEAVTLRRALIVADAGQVVNPDGLSNQLVGGLVQAASWTLHERVRWDAGGVTSRDWNSYPILRLSETPEVRTVLINRPGAPFLGAGEASQGPTPAAIANAVWDATGVRLRRVPFVLGE